MGAGVWGWNPQLWDESPPVRLARSGRNNFLKKKVFRKNVIRTKIFVHLYGLFFVRIFFRNSVFFWKKAKNKKSSKERNSKEKNEFRKNAIRSNDLVPSPQSKQSSLPESILVKLERASKWLLVFVPIHQSSSHASYLCICVEALIMHACIYHPYTHKYIFTKHQ